MTSKPPPWSVTSSAPASSTAARMSSSVDAVGLGDDDDALAVEVVGDAARVGHRAAVAGHERAHLGGRAVLVVGEALDEQGDAVGAVALVHDRRVVDRLAGEAGAALDGAVDVVVGDRGLLGLLHGVDEGRVAREVGAAHLGGDLDVLDELGERLRTALSMIAFLCLVVAHLEWPDMRLLNRSRCASRRVPRQPILSQHAPPGRQPAVPGAMPRLARSSGQQLVAACGGCDWSSSA